MLRTVRVEPGYLEFASRAREGNLIPVWCEILADTETPISAFLKIRDLPYAFLLESVEGSQKLARYSFLGGRPLLVVATASDGTTEVQKKGGIQRRRGDPLEIAREVLSPYRPVDDPNLRAVLPRFTGGLLGYFGYDLVRWWENLPNKPPDDLGCPVIELVLVDTVLAFDHLTNRIRVIAHAFIEEDDVHATYRRAVERVEEMVEKLGTPARARERGDGRAERNATVTVEANIGREEFLSKVATAKEYIFAGDIFQVILSQRFRVSPILVDPFDLYRALRAINPSPYMFYLDFPTVKLVGASPEMLVRLEGEEVEMRPIAGTRPRGTTPEEDERLAEDLLQDEKERAEHIMLVDLTRNDLGRISRYGSVTVSELMTIERYSHVMHLVSTISGKLAAGRNAFDVLRAVFPHGTVTGAPKVRAMEIIDELEPTARGPYAGAVGYVDFRGNMDTAITIRTILVKEGSAYIQAGAGIVADSIPEREFEETVNKARALLKAIELAGSPSRPR
ncbi:MAG: anthranilate synthase component I [Armatimonadota bacterium]|nr:anthranilate synthase component I [Armatimonadota bacterium]